MFNDTSRPRHRHSISTRLAFHYGVSMISLMALVFIVVSVGFVVPVHRNANQRLIEEQHRLLPWVAFYGEEPAWTGNAEDFPSLLSTQGSETFLRLFSRKGRLLFQSPNFEGRPPLSSHIPDGVEATRASRAWGLPIVRSQYTPLITPAGALRGWLELSVYEYSSHHDFAVYGLFLIVGFVLSAVFVAAGGYGFAKHALRPVSTLTKAANKIRATDLSVRLPVHNTVRDELTELAETFNAMLARLEASFDRERRFTTHAAHELLTPLTLMRGEVDLALRRTHDARAVEGALSEILEDIKRMSTMVERLLRLSRVEAMGNVQRQPVNLSKICATRLARFQLLTETHEIHFQHDIDSDVFVAASRIHLEEVLDNVLDNALKYTPPGGAVAVRLQKEEHACRLIVTDTGIGFDPPEGTLLFEQFYRSDAPEVQAQQGSGLGLAIVKTIVTAYQGTLCVHSEGRHQGSTFEVTFPLSEKINHLVETFG